MSTAYARIHPFHVWVSVGQCGRYGMERVDIMWSHLSRIPASFCLRSRRASATPAWRGGKGGGI